MANIFFRFWRVGSILLLTVVLLYCYTNLPETIAVGFNEAGNPISFVDKQTFFYWTAGAILGVNFFVALLGSALSRADFSSILGSTSWGKNSGAVQNFFRGWIAAFLAFVNTYLVFVLLGLLSINMEVDQTLDFNYNYLLWLGILIFAILIIFIPYRLLATEAPNED